MRGPAAPGTRIPLMIHLINLKSDNSRILSKCRQIQGDQSWQIQGDQSRQIQGDQSWQIQGDQSSELLKGAKLFHRQRKNQKKTKKNEKLNLIE